MPTRQGESDSVEESINNELSEIGGEACKICGEAGHAHHEIGVKIGVFVRRHQLLTVEDVDVDQRTSLGKVTENQALYNGETLLVTGGGERLWELIF